MGEVLKRLETKERENLCALTSEGGTIRDRLSAVRLSLFKISSSDGCRGFIDGCRE